MRYLNYIHLSSITLSKEEESYLDEQAAFESWCYKNKGQHGRSIHINEAMIIFKDDLFSICADHISHQDNPAHWKNIMLTLEDKKSLEFSIKIQQAKSYPIDQLCSQLGYPPNSRDMCQSPFLEKQRTGSMKLYRNNNTWYDFGVSQGGDTIDLVQKVCNFSFKQSVEYLI